MKKRFDFKLTISVVSLFVSFLLVVFGSGNRFCLFFGFLFMASALFAMSFYSTDRIKKKLSDTQTEISNIENGINPTGAIYSEEELLTLLNTEKQLKKQIRSCRFSFNVSAVILCVVAIFVLI